MRLICPNCDAQYEVDDSAIPETGRDVQCSNCGHGWFHMREVALDDQSRGPGRTASALDADDDPYDPPPPEPVAPIQRKLDESVLSILREEADRELAARKAEAAAGLEMQGDLGLPPPVSPMVGSSVAAPLTATGRRIVARQNETAPPPRTRSRRDLLPDIEEINSTLRPNEAAASLEDTDGPAQDRSAAGFRSGFLLVLILTGLALGVYVMSAEIAAEVPAAADALAAYVIAVDDLRVTLDGLIQRGTEALNGMTGS